MNIKLKMYVAIGGIKHRALEESEYARSMGIEVSGLDKENRHDWITLNGVTYYLLPPKRLYLRKINTKLHHEQKNKEKEKKGHQKAR